VSDVAVKDGESFFKVTLALAWSFVVMSASSLRRAHIEKRTIIVHPQQQVVIEDVLSTRELERPSFNKRRKLRVAGA
jgi:hypothetical protein